jgi:hypothetical protein
MNNPIIVPEAGAANEIVEKISKLTLENQI